MGGVVVAAGAGTALTAISSPSEALAVELQTSDFGATASVFLLMFFQRRGCLRLFRIEYRRVVLGSRGRVIEKHIEEVPRQS